MQLQPDWAGMFAFSIPPLEIFLRGTLVYWFILVLLRAAGRRDVGSLGVADMLVLVLIADAAQNAMAGDYKSVPDGMVLVATIVGWTWAIDRAGYHFPRLDRLLAPPRVCLVRDGQIQMRNLRREYVTREELMAELRLKGVDDLSSVRRAYMESNGEISVLGKRAD
ncbi:Protein of uncharacterised function (DUF421) [Bordetella ansorpii]|uniref:Protein of uncharacterized function (DUF421) n=1 Tax=Bordetella ansorpii TaxID=288768 RepID=A0A157ME14_9BORD|nr:YetF domain-containing protein [Bordetella ansorpii]SAI06924.1 Protein of uncharacterised function (DUF421) [Bordetella ansorpii]